MRRNLTISFDDGFIEWLDGQRGKTSRGAYLEAACPKARHIETIPQTWAAPAKDKRSPDPQTEASAVADRQMGKSPEESIAAAKSFWPPSEITAADVEAAEAERQARVKPSLQRPIIQKSGT